MQIKELHFYHLRIPLRLTFAQANQQTRFSDSVVLRLRTQDGTLGFGECGPRPYVTGEDAASVRNTFRDLAPELVRKDFSSLDDIRAYTLGLLDAATSPAAVCAVELALLDAWSKTSGISLFSAFEVSSLQSLAYSGVVPFGCWEKLAPILRQFSFPQWKFKATIDHRANVERIQQLRCLANSAGDVWPQQKDDFIRMDANGGWSLAQAQQNIEYGLAHGVCSFEQPVAAKDELAAQVLTDSYGSQASIMADEALVSYADAQRFIAHRAYNHFNLKLSKNGGLFNCLRIYELARAHDIPCQLGAQYGETTILTAAGVLLAHLVPSLSALEGALGSYLLQDDIVDKPLMVERNGRLALDSALNSAGLTAVNELKINRFSVLTQTIKSTPKPDFNKNFPTLGGKEEPIF